MLVLRFLEARERTEGVADLSEASEVWEVVEVEVSKCLRLVGVMVETGVL